MSHWTWISIPALVILLLNPVGVSADALDDLLEPGSNEAVSAQGASIDVENDARIDAAIRSRLRGIFGELEDLGEIAVNANNGIVTLSGSVESAQSAERALALASQVVGVIEVIDELAVEADVSQRVESTMGRLQDALLSFVSALPVIVLAVLVVVLFWWAGRQAGQHRRLFLLIAPNSFIAELLATVARIVVTVAGLIVALSLLEATSLIGSVLGAAGIVGLAVGFAVRDTVENFIASILLSLRSPFLARDYVRIGDHEGTVARLTSRATILISRDGNHVRVPNALVYKSVIVNFSRQPERRFEYRVGVGTGLDLNLARRIAEDTMQDVEGVLSQPMPAALIEELADSSVTLVVAAWVDQRVSDLLKVRSESIRQVKHAFDMAGIVMPEPTYRVDLRQVEDGDPAAEPSDSRSTATAAKQGSLGESVETVAAISAGDTAVDDVIQQKVDLELTESGGQNLLPDATRQE